MRLPSTVLLASLVSSVALGQTYTISTFVGGALPPDIPGTSASFASFSVSGVAIDGGGNVFIVDSMHGIVLRLDATSGSLTLAAGSGTRGFSGDNGPATSAQLNATRAAVDATGNLYIGDTTNHRIRMVSNGVITTIAGSGTRGFSGDNGPAVGAELNNPTGVAVDSAGNLYIADAGNQRIRKISNGVITTLAGNGKQGFSGDNGPAANAELNNPTGVAVDAGGNVYVADSFNNRIRMVANGLITTVAGNGSQPPIGDNGPATSAELSAPYGVAVDSAGNLYIADTGDNRIREVSNGVINTVAGIGSQGHSGDNGPANGAQLGVPLDLAVDSLGNLFIADSGNARIRELSNGVITTAAGTTQGPSGDNGPAASAQLDVPLDVAVDTFGNLYIADGSNNRIRMVSNGVITTVAGNGTAGFSGDNGPATGAQLNDPGGVAVDAAGNLYIADTRNSRIRRVSTGVITTVAGIGSAGFSGDNLPATRTQLNGPRGITVDLAGKMYIADSGNARIREVSNGVITTIAGNGTRGFSGDNGPATSAQLSDPTGITADSGGNLYFADSSNNRIRKISNGLITTVGGGGSSLGDSGPAISAELNSPYGVAVDSNGDLYIADTSDNRIRKVSNGVIATVAGNGTAGFSGDNGTATNAQMNSPQGLAMDSASNLYIADSNNNVIRILTRASCTYSIAPASLQPSASGGRFSVAIQTMPWCSWMVSGLPNWITVSGAASANGPGAVTLILAPNTSGAAMNATISIGDVTLTITQCAGSTAVAPSNRSGRIALGRGGR